MEELNFSLKPHLNAYRYVQQQHSGYSRIIFCDDRAENLNVAKQLGWETVMATYINSSQKNVEGHTELDSFENLIGIV